MRSSEHSDAIGVGYQMCLVQLLGGAERVHHVQLICSSDHLDAVGAGYQMCLVRVLGGTERVHHV